jgi:hypothetical protein
MSIKTVLIGLLLFLIALPVSAQSKNCGSGLPCGPLPWALPSLPNLSSPTPMPTIVITDESAGVDPEVTETPAPPGVDLDTGGIDSSFATLNAIMASTPMVLLNAEGTAEPIMGDVDENASVFFSYAKGMTTDWAGPIAPLVSLTLTAFVTVIGVKIITFVLPLVSAIFGIVRKVISLILDFLPF